MTPSRSIQALMRMVLGAAVVLGVGGSAAGGTALAAGAGSLKGPPEAGHDFTVAGLPLTYPSANVAAVVILGLAGIGFIALVQAGRSARRYAMPPRRCPRGAAGPGSPASHPIRRADPRPIALCAGLLRPR